MAKQIILATHASLAKGFAESLHFIFEPADRIHTICAFTEIQNPGKAFEELVATFSPKDKIVVLTDLVGGSVNKAIAEKLRVCDFFLLSGINLALLLEIASCEEAELTGDFIRKAIELCQNEMIFMNDKLIERAAAKTEESFF